MYILYGSCVRFYSTVVEWDFLNQMKEDLIELLTSLVFSNPQFSSTVLQLCYETTKDQERRFQDKVLAYPGLKPIHVGIDEYLTLDSNSNIEAVYS
jgi:ABC-type Zn2+ transport system substrate-binding protein/surface adhesin